MTERNIQVLSEINLTINPNEIVLVRGDSGSGKSSLLRILAGIVNPTKGNVFVGEHNLESVQINNYRSHLGLALSEESPFEGTIKENLTFGNTSI